MALQEPHDNGLRGRLEQRHNEAARTAENIAAGAFSRSSVARYLEPVPYRFRGLILPRSFRSYGTFAEAQNAPTPLTERMVEALRRPGVDIPVYRYVAAPGFGLAGQSVLRAFDRFDPTRPFMTLDTEWLGRGETNLFAPTEIALSFVRGGDIQVASTLIAPGAEQVRELRALIDKARSGKRLNADEWRTLRDLMRYAPSSVMNLPGAVYRGFGEIAAHAQWVQQLQPGSDLRPYLSYAEEGLAALIKYGRPLSEAAQWFDRLAAERIARGEPVLTWNGIRADFPVLREAFGSESNVARLLSQAVHVDLLATVQTVTSDPVSEVLEQMLGRKLAPAELRSMGGYLQQESIASLLGIRQQAHLAGSDVRTLGLIAQRMAPVLKRVQARARIPGAGAVELPGQQVYDPRTIQPGQLLYALRGVRAPYAELYEGGRRVADPYAYRGVRTNYTYRVQAIRPFEAEGRTYYGVSLQPVHQPERTLFLGFETEDDLYRFFQGFTPAPDDPEALERARLFALQDSARRRYFGFTEPRPGSAYGFAAARQFYHAAARIDLVDAVTDDELRKVYGFKTEAQIRDFRQLHARLASEAWYSVDETTGQLTGRGILQAIQEIEARIPESDPTRRTLAFAAFMRRLNEAQGFTWEGPMEEVELPLSRRVSLELSIPGLDGTREINLVQRNTAVSSLHRIVSETAAALTGRSDEAAMRWALRARVLPAIEQAGLLLERDEIERVLRHQLLHEQVRELANVLISKDVLLEGQRRLMPSVGPRPIRDASGRDILWALRDTEFIRRMVTEAIEEVSSIVHLTLPKPGEPLVLEGPAAELFARIDAMIRAPFSEEVGRRFGSAREAVANLMRRLHDHGLAAYLIGDDAGKMYLAVTPAEHADEVFASIHRRGWANRDRERIAWFELPAVEHGGYTTGGRLSRPVADVILRPDGSVEYVLRSRFEHALDIDNYTLRNIALAFAEGSAQNAERIFRRAVNRRLEQAPWTRTPWDDPLWDRNEFTLNLAVQGRLMKVETTERLVRHIAMTDPEVQKLGGIEPDADLMMLPRRVKLALEQAVQRRIPELFGIQTQFSALKGEDVAKFRIGLAEGDVAPLYPWGEHLDIGRSAPRQALAMTPILPERLAELISSGPREIVPGSLVTTASRRALEEKLGVPISSTTVRAAVVGREDIREALEAAVRSGRITEAELEQILESGFFTTADEQIIVSSRLARVHALRETIEMRLAPDAILQSRITQALDRYGNAIPGTEVIFGFGDVIAEVKRHGKTEQILMDHRNALAILQGVRRDEKTGELIVRFQLQRELEQGSRVRLGTHKGVSVVHPYLERIFPGVDVLFFGKFTKRGQIGELAAGLIARAAMHYAFDERSRARFLEELRRETGIEAQWVRAPQRDGVLMWQLQLPESGDIPMRRILEFVERRGGVTEELYPGGPRVLTLVAEFARLEQEERLLKNISPLQTVHTGEGIYVGPREQDVLRRHGLESINRWIRSFAEVAGAKPRVDPEQAWNVIRAVAGEAELPVRRLSEFDIPVPVKALDSGYRPEDIIGTVFDVGTTGRQAFWLDLELPDYERATGLKARVAVVPEELLAVRGEWYLGELNQKLRSIIETANEIVSFHAGTARQVELAGSVTLEELYLRLTRQISEYREAVRASVTDYSGALFQSGGIRNVVPGSWARLHVIDSAIDRIEPYTVEVPVGYFKEMGIDPEAPYALFARFPTDPQSIQVVRLRESARVRWGQIAVSEVLGHAVGGDTDSDVAALFAMNAPLKRQLERAGLGPDHPLWTVAEDLDRMYREQVLPELRRVHQAQLQGTYPLGVVSEEAWQALHAMGGYEQLIEDPGTGLMRPMTPEERLRAILPDQDVVPAPDTKGRWAHVLFQRQSASVIGTISNEVQRRLALADYLWGGRPEMAEDMAKLADFLDIIKEKAISAQKHDTGRLSPQLVEKYGDQPAVAIREAIRGANFDDLEAILVALGGDAKTQRDLTQEFVKEHVDILRRLHREAGPDWNHPFLEVGLRGAGRITERQLLSLAGPMTPAVEAMLRATGHTDEQIEAMRSDSRARLAQQALAGLTSPEIERFVAETTQQTGQRSLQTIRQAERIQAGFKGAAAMGAIMAAAWLLPKAISGPPADLSRPDREEAGLSPQLEALLLPQGQVPNVQAVPPPVLQSGLTVQVRARAPRSVLGEELAALIEQAVSSATQVKLDVTARIVDDRTVIDRQWIQAQLAAALGD